MIRTQVYLTKTEKSKLATVAEIKGVSQSVLIRQAVDELLFRNESTDVANVLKEVAGIWSDRKDLPDVRELRAGWNRE